MTTDLQCPHCGSQAFTDYGDGLVACQQCSVQFNLNEQQCPYCGSLLAEGTFVCLQCGTDRRGDLAQRTIEETPRAPKAWRHARVSPAQQTQDKNGEEKEKAALECPHCSGKAFTDYGDGLVACQRCYVQFDLNQQQCPQCGSLLAESIFICLQCGTDLRGDLAGKIIQGGLMTTRDWRRARLSQVQQVRNKAQEASHQRLEAWWDKDRQRREAELQEEMARQRHRRRVLVITMAIIAIVILLIALIALIVYSSLQPDPTPTALLLQWSIGS